MFLNGGGRKKVEPDAHRFFVVRARRLLVFLVLRLNRTHYEGRYRYGR